MITSRIAADAGDRSDGWFYGGPKETTVDTYLLKPIITSAVKVVRMDNTPTGESFTDLSAVSTSTDLNDVELWGTIANLSLADAVFISNGAVMKQIFFRIMTAGAYTTSGLRLWDSTNGSAAKRELVITNDATNAFRNTGWQALTWTQPATEMQSFALNPQSEETLYNTAYPWYKITFNGLSNITATPLLSRILGHYPTDGQKYLNATAYVGGDTNPAVAPTSLATIFPTIDDEAVMITPTKPTSIVRYVFRRIEDFGARLTKYLSTDGTYKLFQNLVDPSDGLRNGPAVSTIPPIRYETTWSMPTDMASVTKTWPMTDGTTLTTTGYIVTFTHANITAPGEYSPAISVARVKKFGPTAVGEAQLTARTLKGVVINRVGAMSANTTIEKVNVTTGQAASLVINTTDDFPITKDITDISFAVDDKLGGRFVDGAEMKDVEMEHVWG